MIKILNNLITKTLVKQPRFYLFDWLKTKKSKEEEDDSVYDPATWHAMQQTLEKVKQSNLNKPKLLPIKKGQYKDKLTVVMEMDEVLVYSFVPDEKDMFINAPLRSYDHFVDLPEYDYFVNVYKREHLDEYLKYFLTQTEPVIWSKGTRVYVERVLEKICPQFPKDHLFCQEECNLVEEEDIEDFIKDIDRLGRDRKKLVYVDANPINFWTFGDNSIPIKMFTADNTESKDDLLILIDLLERLRQEEDVRDFLGKRFKIEDTMRETKLID